MPARGNRSLSAPAKFQGERIGPGDRGPRASLGLVRELTRSPHPSLLPDDFMLVLMNRSQVETLRQFGKGCGVVCFDSIPGSTGVLSDFQLTSLMVGGERGEGVPVAFCVCLTGRISKLWRSSHWRR